VAYRISDHLTLEFSCVTAAVTNNLNSCGTVVDCVYHDGESETVFLKHVLIVGQIVLNAY
jgi:hypothetical protein